MLTDQQRVSDRCPGGAAVTRAEQAAQIAASDLKGWITAEGAEAAGTGDLSDQPPGARPQGAREEVVRMTRLRRRIAERLKEAQHTAAILTTFNEVDMGRVMDARAAYRDIFERKHGVRLGFMGFFVRASVLALQELPAVNAEIDGDSIIYKNYYNVGVAVGTPQGLVVPAQTAGPGRRRECACGCMASRWACR